VPVAILALASVSPDEADYQVEWDYLPPGERVAKFVREEL
jgi:hypothetical protein